MDRHVYFGIENLNLNDIQRDTLVGVLNTLGPLNDALPCYNNHRRVRLDGQAAIYEALWNEDTITIQTFKTHLGDIFNVDPTTITHSVNQVMLNALNSAVVTFIRSGTSYLRVVFFGYDGMTWPTWEQSRGEVIAYLVANAAEWGEA